MRDLLARLDQKHSKDSKLKSALQRLAWPLNKADTQRNITRIDRLKAFLVLFIISDDLLLCREVCRDIRAVDDCCSIKKATKNVRRPPKCNKHSKIGLICTIPTIYPGNRSTNFGWFIVWLQSFGFARSQVPMRRRYFQLLSNTSKIKISRP